METETLFDITGESINPNFVDEKQPLFIPTRPMHYKAHRLQVLLARLDKQAERNPAQFNSTAYLNVLERYTECCQAIKEGKEDEVLGSGNVAEERTGRSKAPSVGEGASAGLDFGVSTDNPLAG
jgi:hypothetical protein